MEKTKQKLRKGNANAIKREGEFFKRNFAKQVVAEGIIKTLTPSQEWNPERLIVIKGVFGEVYMKLKDFDEFIGRNSSRIHSAQKEKIAKLIGELGEHGIQHIETLSELLIDDDLDVGNAALQTWNKVIKAIEGKALSKEEIEVIGKFIAENYNSIYPEKRKRVAELIGALGKKYGREYANYLVVLSLDWSFFINETAKEAWNKVMDVSIEEYMKNLKKEDVEFFDRVIEENYNRNRWGRYIVAKTIEVLGKYGIYHIDKLSKLLTDSDVDVRKAAEEAWDRVKAIKTKKLSKDFWRKLLRNLKMDNAIAINRKYG